jgi:hypothetical protein
MEMYNLELPNIPTSKGTYDNGRYIPSLMTEKENLP